MRSAGRQQARGGAPLTSPPLHVPSPAGPPQAAWPFSHCSQGPQTLKPPSVHVKQEGDVRPASCEGGLGAARIGECPTDGDEGPRAEAPARGPAILGQRAPCHSRSAGGRPGQAGGSGPSALQLPWPLRDFSGAAFSPAHSARRKHVHLTTSATRTYRSCSRNWH